MFFDKPIRLSNVFHINKIHVSEAHSQKQRQNLKFWSRLQNVCGPLPSINKYFINEYTGNIDY